LKQITYQCYFNVWVKWSLLTNLFDLGRNNLTKINLSLADNVKG
jgi:hypothetical protein